MTTHEILACAWVEVSTGAPWTPDRVKAVMSELNPDELRELLRIQP